ncbi:MAG: hypothetical protein JSV62_03130 [Promethearchaeota archaeon]|nr:MAG: hypothetical protein JSV62_03130 [Candidatus Lokiarchaeota archaeon]
MMVKTSRKEEKGKVKKAMKIQKLKRESDILQKVENFRTTPCGFQYSDMIKRRFKKSY